MKFKKIDDNTVVIDARDSSITDRQIVDKACEVLFNSKAVIKDRGKSGSGSFLIGNMLEYYNVASIAEGIIVASKNDMNSKQTRAIAKEFLKELEVDK